MIKNTVLALVAVATLGTATSTFAATNFGSEGDNAFLTDEAISLNVVQNRLEHQGLNVSNVESWGTKIRAIVTNDNGQITQHFFDRDTLAPVDARG